VLFLLLGVGSHVGWLHSWDNLRATQFAPKWTRSERSKWYVMPKQCLASYSVLTTSTESRLEDPHSRGAGLFSKMKAGPFWVC